jgi:hypothetical protein
MTPALAAHQGLMPGPNGNIDFTALGGGSGAIPALPGGASGLAPLSGISGSSSLGTSSGNLAGKTPFSDIFGW